MATRKIKDERLITAAENASDVADSIVSDIISSMNKQEGGKVAFRLDDPNNPSNIKSFISTGIKGLDYAISNRKNGGIPMGRITNFFGREGSGKSLLAIKAAAQCQKDGGIVVYFDSESALDQEFPEHLGLKRQQTVVVTDLTIEKVFDRMELLINKFRENPKTKDKKLLIIWDSIAGTVSQKEQEIEMADITKMMAVRARLIGAGLRKIGQKIARENIALIVLNQLSIDITVSYGDNETQSGGRQLLHWCTVIVKLNKKNFQTEGKGDQAEGKSVDVRAKIVKNRCGPPFRTYEFTMDYLSGPHEYTQIVGEINRLGESIEVNHNGKNLMFRLYEAAGKYSAILYDPSVNPNGDKDGTVVMINKFSKNHGMDKFVENSPDWEQIIDQVLDHVWLRKYQSQEVDDDDNYLSRMVEMDEMKSLAMGLSGESDEYDEEFSDEEVDA
jgi:recombination protein RecA